MSDPVTKLSEDSSAGIVGFGSTGITLSSGDVRGAGGDSDIEFLSGDDSLDILKRSNKYNRATFTKLVKIIKDHIDKEETYRIRQHLS